MASDIIQRWKASAYRQVCLLLLPFTHARTESINADSLNSNFLQLGRRSGGRPQRTVHPMRLPCQHCVCDTHYFSRPRTRNLPIVGWLLVRRATSATNSPYDRLRAGTKNVNDFSESQLHSRVSCMYRLWYRHAGGHWAVQCHTTAWSNVEWNYSRVMEALTVATLQSLYLH